MSVGTLRGTCEHCGSDHAISNAVDQFCSVECKYQSRGENAIRNIEKDHRFCSTCYKPLKVVFRPADSETPKLRTKSLVVRDSFVGFQEFTKFAQSGDYGIECECGNVQHYHAEETLRDGEPYEWFLKLCFTKFRDEGQMDRRFDIETFANTYWETNDFELSVGKALYS